MEIEMTKIVGKLAILTVIGSCATIAYAGQALAQKSDSDSKSPLPIATIGATEDGSPSQPPAAPTPQKAATDPDEGWHFAVSPYLWLAGMHGTVGAFGHDASVHASFGDIFHNLNMGLMGAGEARHNKV